MLIFLIANRTSIMRSRLWNLFDFVWNIIVGFESAILGMFFKHRKAAIAA